MGDRGTHVYNPASRPAEDLPTIYGFTNALDVREDGAVVGAQGELVAQDGKAFGECYSSNEGFLLVDLGILPNMREDRHRDFADHYPDGYKMEFVSFGDVTEHEGLRQAIRNSDTLAGRFEFAEAKMFRKGF